MPWEWLVSRTCEEFHCLPEVAVHALENDPEHLITTILTMRGYSDMKREYDSAKTSKEVAALPSNNLMDLVKEIDCEVTPET